MPLLITLYGQGTNPEQVARGDSRARVEVVRTAKRLGEARKIPGPRPVDGFYSVMGEDKNHGPGWLDHKLVLDEGRTPDQKGQYAQAVLAGFEHTGLNGYIEVIDAKVWRFPPRA